jgi:hypothetical protein
MCTPRRCATRARRRNERGRHATLSDKSAVEQSEAFVERTALPEFAGKSFRNIPAAALPIAFADLALTVVK